jgi:hypothetical protein
VTQFFGGGAVYRMTPTTEVIARSVAKANQPEPVHRWELPALAAVSPSHVSGDTFGGDGNDYDDGQDDADNSEEG